MVEKSCIVSLEPIPRTKGKLVHFFCIFGFWGCGLLCEIGLTDFRNRSDQFWWNRPDRFVPKFGTCSGGACICVGGALLCFGGLCFLLEHGLSRMCRAVALA
jgi:hypothetical protein